MPIILLFLFLVACGEDPPVYRSAGDKNVNTVDGERKWAKTPTVYISEDMPYYWDEVAVWSIRQWNLAAGKTLFFYGGRKEKELTQGMYSTLNDGENFIYYTKDWVNLVEKPSETIGTTFYRTNSSGSIISESDVIINGEHYSFFASRDEFGGCLEGSWVSDLPGFQESESLVYAQNIMLHELGHLLGLDHTEEEGSIMRPTERVFYLDVLDNVCQRVQDRDDFYYPKEFIQDFEKMISDRDKEKIRKIYK